MFYFKNCIILLKKVICSKIPSFSDEAVESRHEMYWLPFGYGPRICLGYKFAILEIKTAISSILQKYELQVVEETPKKLTYIQKFTLLPAGEIPVKVVPRN